MNFSQVYKKLQISYEFRVQSSLANSRVKTKEKIPTRISEIRARILKEESNLCTKLNKPAQLHQDRNSKISSFDNYMVSF